MHSARDVGVEWGIEDNVYGLSCRGTCLTEHFDTAIPVGWRAERVEANGTLDLRITR